ncbi:MAG: hypothetical protein ACOCWC_03770 [Bacteroidota bacterium]
MKKQFRSDLLKFLLWIFVAFIAANFMPSAIALGYIGYLSYKYITSRDVLVYFFVFISLLAGLAGLYGNSFDGLVSVSLIEFRLVQIFIFVNYIKYFTSKGDNKPVFHFKRPIIIFLLYFVFLIFWGFIYGVEETGRTGLRHYYQIANIIILIPVFLVLPYNLIGENFINRLSYLLFISLFINIAGQAFMLIWGVPVFQFLNPDPNYSIVAGEINYMQESIRPIMAPWLIILALFLSFFAIIKKAQVFKLNFLSLAFFASCLSIFITATRGWILAFIIFIILGALLFSINISKKVIGVFVVGIVLFLVLYSTSNLFKVQVDKSFDRLSTVELIIEGDLSAGGTNKRHIRGAKVMEGFYKSPIIGLGFSSEGLEYTDQHVGNQMILLSGGILGYFIILYIFSSIIIKTFGFNTILIKSPASNSQYNRELKLIPVFLASLFMIHSTSTSLFGFSIYTTAYGNMLWVVIFISIINKIFNEYLNEQQRYSYNH